MLISLLISNLLLVHRVRDSERELAQLRREQGKLVVDDPDQHEHHSSSRAPVGLAEKLELEGLCSAWHQD